MAHAGNITEVTVCNNNNKEEKNHKSGNLFIFPCALSKGDGELLGRVSLLKPFSITRHDSVSNIFAVEFKALQLFMLTGLMKLM